MRAEKVRGPTGPLAPPPRLQFRCTSTASPRWNITVAGEMIIHVCPKDGLPPSGLSILSFRGPVKPPGRFVESRTAVLCTYTP